MSLVFTFVILAVACPQVVQGVPVANGAAHQGHKVMVSAGGSFTQKKTDPAPTPAPPVYDPTYCAIARPCSYSHEECAAVASCAGLDITGFTSSDGTITDFLGEPGAPPLDSIGCFAYMTGDYAGKAFYGQVPTDDPAIFGDVTDPAEVDGMHRSGSKNEHDVTVGVGKYRLSGWGCCSLDKYACQAVASQQGMTLGDATTSFNNSDYATKGCYAWNPEYKTTDDKSFKDNIFYGEVNGAEVNFTEDLNVVETGLLYTGGPTGQLQYRPGGINCSRAAPLTATTTVTTAAAR